MLLSVIVPAYNAEKYVKRCFQCLKEQTYTPIEIIFINDGSQDKTANILDEIVAQEKNVTVIHKKNGGLSSARNAGMDRATGEYIFFLDIDDWIENDYFENCMSMLKKNSVSILFTPYIREYKTTSMINPLFPNEYIFFSKEDVKDKLLLKLFGPVNSIEKNPIKMNNLNTAWGKFYKKSIIENLKFSNQSEVGTAEDLWFNVFAFFEADDAVYLGTQYLHYNKTNENSIISTYHPELGDTLKKLFDNMNNFIIKKELGERFQQALNNRIVLSTFEEMLSLCYSSLSFKEKRKFAVSILKEKQYRKALKSFKYDDLSVLWKIFFKLEEKYCVRFVLWMVLIGIRMRGRINP